MTVMTLEKYTIDEIKDAYRKLKSYVYYDNYNLLLRKKVAEFEGQGSVEEKFHSLLDAINNSNKKALLDEYFEQISYWVFPKNIKPEKLNSDEAANGDEDHETVISNIDFCDRYYTDRPTFFIDAPIELHTLSVLWIEKIGNKLEKSVKPSPYGYKLELDEEGEVVKGLRLFVPYFKKYQEWRNRAINAAEYLVNKKKNALILGLDIRNCFHTLYFNFLEVTEYLKSMRVRNYYQNLTNILERIHIQYAKILPEIDENFCPDGKYFLPIGLLSSGVIANWYLRCLDEAIVERINPEYYGRYVDDILIVISNPKLEDIRTAKHIYNAYFKTNGILKEEDQTKKNGGKYIVLEDIYKNKNLIIQDKKFSILFFDHNEPIGVLKKYKSDIRKNSSEFRFLPEEELLNSEFDAEAYYIKYAGSKQKIRNINEFNEDKFGISKFLAERIMQSLQTDEKSDVTTTRQILSFFKKRRSIEFRELWEKLFTYFLINEQTDDIITLIDIFIHGIESLKIYQSLKGCEKKIKETLFSYLEASLSTAFSLSPKSFNSKMEKYFDSKKNISGDEIFSRINQFSNNIRKTNLMRHHYIVFPLVNYTELILHKIYQYKLTKSDYKTLFTSSLISRPDQKLYEYSPRFIHFHEAVIFTFLRKVYLFQNNNIENRSTNILDGYLEESFDIYYKINYQRGIVIKDNEKYEDIKSQIFITSIDDKNSVNKGKIHCIEVDSNKNVKRLTIALANMRLPEFVLDPKYLRSQMISKSRRDQLFTLINDAKRALQKSINSLTVFPEISIPNKIFPQLCKFSCKEQIAMTFGLEHIISNNFAFNFVVSLLPVELNKFNALVPIIRLKNHYSPEEERKFIGYGYKIPKQYPQFYHLIKWRHLYFTVFNCYELANISHRALFKSKIDLLVACEYNPDVNYFSNIVESSSRELHCYFIQSNNAQYGDSRITQPSKTEIKDIVKIKGGRNYTIIVDEIDIDKLREFQVLSYELQKDDKNYKPTPPDFKKNKVMRRINESENYS